MVSFSSHFLHDVEGLAKAPKKPFRLVPKHQKGTGDMGCASVKVQEVWGKNGNAVVDGKKGSDVHLPDT